MSEAKIEGDEIVIRVKIDALPVILDGACSLGAIVPAYKVTDAAAFAKEVCREINAEDDDGTTRFHRMFDGAMDEAIEQGADGVEEGDDEEE